MTAPPSAPDLVAIRALHDRASQHHEAVDYYSLVLAIRSLLAEIERLSHAAKLTEERDKQLLLLSDERKCEIERLTALAEERLAAAEQAEAVAQTEAHKLLKLSEKWNALCMEHDRLRAALEQIARSGEFKGASDITPADWVAWAGDIAREALRREADQVSRGLRGADSADEGKK
jgi:hypothetical protein